MREDLRKLMKTIVAFGLVFFAMSASSVFGKGQTEGAVKPIMEISWGGIGFDRMTDGNWAQKRLEAKFGVKIINRKVNIGTVEQVNLMLASGEMPDFCRLYMDSNNLYYDQGITRSIPKEYLRKYAPNYTKMLDNNPLGWLMHTKKENPDEYLAVTGLDSYNDRIAFVQYWRLDWLQKLNLLPPGEKLEQIDKAGRISFMQRGFTRDDMERFFIAFRDGDPDQNGKKDTIPMAAPKDVINTFDGLMATFGFVSGSDYNQLVDGELLPWNLLPAYKDFLKFAAGWYKMGIIDSEFPTLTLAKNNDKITTGQVGYWQAPDSYVQAQYITSPPLSVLARDPKATILISGPPIGPKGNQGGYTKTPVTALTWVSFFSKSVSDSKLARILEIFDYINFDKEGFIWYRYGLPGENFDWEGEPWNSAPISRPETEKRTDLGVGYTNYSFVTVEPDKNIYYPSDLKKLRKFTQGEWLNLVLRPYKLDYFGKTGVSKVTKQYGATVNTIRDEFLLGAITGQIDIDAKWPEYVNKWKTSGGDAIIAELKKAPIVAELRKGVQKF